MLVLLSQETLAETEVLTNSTPEYWAPVLTFIVGFLGIVSQVIVSYFLEKKKITVEIRKTQIKERVEFYLPLLTLLKKWNFYYNILKKYSDFCLFNFECENDFDKNKYFLELKNVYTSLETLLSQNYVFSNNNLEKELNKLREHIWDTRMKWDIGYSGTEIQEIDIQKIITLVSKQLEKY